MVGDRLRAARETRGLTQGAVARAIDVDRNTINRTENNHTLPRVDILRAWARVLDVTLESLLVDDVWPNGGAK